ERPDADVENVTRRLRSFVCEPADEIGMNRAVRQDSATARVDPQQVSGARFVDRRKRVEHSGDENRPALMWFLYFLVIRRVGFQRNPFARLVEASDRVTQRATLPGRASELQRQTAENRLRPQVTAGATDLSLEDLGYREVLHQRDDVSERFMQREHVIVRGLVEATMHAVADRVRRFMGHDVVREASVDFAAGHMIAGISRRSHEIPKQQTYKQRDVISVRLAKRVRRDRQLTHKLAVVKFV